MEEKPANDDFFFYQGLKPKISGFTGNTWVDSKFDVINAFIESPY